MRWLVFAINYHMHIGIYFEIKNTFIWNSLILLVIINNVEVLFFILYHSFCKLLYLEIYTFQICTEYVKIIIVTLIIKFCTIIFL